MNATPFIPANTPGLKHVSRLDEPQTLQWLASLGVPSLYFLAAVQVTRADLSSTIEHVNNVRYLAWVDRVAQLHAEFLGYYQSRLMADGVMWFVSRHEIDYRAEAFLNDTLLLATWIESLNRSQSHRRTLLLRPETQTVVAQCLSRWVLVDLATRRPCRVPAAMEAAFRQNQATL